METLMLCYMLCHASTIVNLFCFPHQRRSWTGCSMFNMLQHVWSQGSGNTSVLCLSWCMTTFTGWLFLSKCSTSLLWSPSSSLPSNSIVPRWLLCTSLWTSWYASICDLSDVIDCQFYKFATALLGPVHFLSPDQQSGIRCLIICAIQLSTPKQFSRDLKTYLFAGHLKC